MPIIWHAPSTTYVERKQLLRFLIKDVTLVKQETTIYIGIRWQTEALTELEIPNPQQSLRTDPIIVDRVRELAPTHTDGHIALLFNHEGLLSHTGKSFTKDMVEALRRRYDIPTGCPEAPRMCPGGQRGDGRYSIPGAAKALNVSESTIRHWCQSGRLDSLQSVPGSSRWIELTPEVIAALRKPVRRTRHSSR